jgi:uncharacterized protein
MLVILPPSETKVSGGLEGSCLEIDRLSFPELTAVRHELISELTELAHDEAASLLALKLGPKGGADVVRNREIRSSPVMPALSRYTGVLYDALDVDSLDARALARAHQSIAVFSALFGLIRAEDLIPAYRLSADSALPGGKPATRWSPAGSALWENVGSFVLDLRSGSYRALAPLPGHRGVFVSLVKPGPLGNRPAVGHHNKGVKGRLVRELMVSGAVVSGVDDLVAWGATHGYNFDAASHAAGEIDLVVDL